MSKILKLVEVDNSDEYLLQIEWIKSLLGEGFNRDNYKNMDFNQIYKVLENYKQKFNKSNEEVYVIYVILYSKDTNSRYSGYIVDSDEIAKNIRHATLFSSKKDAKEYFSDYTIPKDFNNYELLKYSINKLHF